MVTIDGTIGHWSPPLVGRLTTIGHTFHLLQSLEIARLHVPPILPSDCKWRSCEASPFGLATSWNSLWLVELLVVRLLDTQSRTTGGATTHEWWCDHTWLVVRPCKTYLRLVIADRSQTVLNMTVDWFYSYDHIRSPTTTTISGTFSLRFDSDS